MADQKVTQLVELTTIVDGDLVYMVDDPGGAPASRKVTVANLFNGVRTVTGLEIKVAAGDPIIVFDIGGTDEFTIGVDDNDGDKFKISLGGALGTNDIITIDPATGSVGIGTTGPNAKLEVVGYIRATHGSDVNDYINFFHNGTGGFVNVQQGDFRFQMAAAAKMTILSTGNVGIGTTGPTALFDINSDILRLRTAKTPLMKGDTGNQGDRCWDDEYLYVCIAANTWHRVAHAALPLTSTSTSTTSTSTSTTSTSSSTTSTSSSTTSSTSTSTSTTSTSSSTSTTTTL